MWQFCEQASKCCVQFASTLLQEGIPQYDRVRMLRTEKEHFAVLVIASHSLEDGHPSLCMIRGCGDFAADLYLAIISPPFGMEHPLISMGMLAF